LLIGIPTGVLSAVKKGTWLDYVANTISLSGLSIPNFWLGIILILFISVKLRLLPASGFVSIFDDPVEAFRTTIMPAFVLGSGLAATLMRHTRSAMLEVLRLDYVRTARAKGLLESKVILKHALRNALVPIVTLSTLLFGQLLAGAVLTEQVFTIPGFGKLIVDAVFNRDYGVVQGVVLCTAISFILMNLIADVLYILINPRLRMA
jgi:peptide/nickel transport system permease protein